MILKFKKLNLTAIKVLFFKKDVDIGKLLVFNKISSGEKNLYKGFIGSLYNGHKVKLLHIILTYKKL